MVALTLCTFTVLSPRAFAQPAARLEAAPLVTPTTAWSYYGASQTHTNGLAASATVAPEIRALAGTLGADRIGTGPSQVTSAEFIQNVYDYVRNNIAIEFRFGLSKGARGALIDQSGTPFDQAELMKKLLAEGGVTSSYRVGAITLTAQEFGRWSGLVKNLNETTQAFNVDAKSACQFLADGGIPATVAGATSCDNLTGNLTGSILMSHVWLQVGSNLYDPSFKRDRLFAGIDLPAAMGCGTEASPTCGGGSTAAMMSGAIQGTTSGSPTLKMLNETGLSTQLATYASNLQTAIDAAGPDAPTEKIVGGQLRDLSYEPTASTILPYAGGGAVQLTWAGDVPDQYRTTFQVQFNANSWLFYADELAGRRIGQATQGMGISETVQFWMVLDGVLLQSVNGPGGTFQTALNHPYAAEAGAYADETNAWRLEQWNSIILSLGVATPSRPKYFADREIASTEMYSGFAVKGGTTTGMQFAAQEMLASKLIAGVTETLITPQHIVGVVSANEFAPGPTLNLSTAMSIRSKIGSVAKRDSAFRTQALMGSLLEGSVLQQAADSVIVYSTPANFAAANEDGATFADITPANYSAIASQLPYAGSAYAPVITNGSSLITPLAKTSTNVTLPNGYYVRIIDGFLSYQAGIEEYWAVDKKGGGAAPSAVDPSKTVMDSIKQSPIALREPISADAATGNLTLRPPPDLLTGFGAFPVSLSFQRNYSSAAAFDEFGALPPYPVSTDVFYGGADAKTYNRIGGGWRHNFDISATIGNDGQLGLGAQRAADASFAIAAIVSIAHQNEVPTFQGRMSSILSASWLGRQLIGNTVSIDLSGSNVTFARRADGAYGPPKGSADRLTVSGARSGPYATATQDWPWDQVATNAAYDYEGVSFVYTRSGGDSLTFTPGRWTNGLPNGGGTLYHPTFLPTAWQFLDGMKVTFTYVTVNINKYNGQVAATTQPDQARRLSQVSNNLGRSLTFSATGENLGTVTDETGRSVSFTRTCAEFVRWNCDAITVTAPGGAVTRYEYSPNPSSPNPAAYVRPGYKLRRWFTPSNGSVPFITFAYDDLFRLRSITDPLSNSSQIYAGAVSGNEIWKRGESVSPVGAEAVSIFDEENRPLRSVDPLGRTTSFTYDDGGRLVLKAFPEGNAEATTYDVRSNPLTSTLKAKPGSGLSDIVTATTYMVGPTVRVCANFAVCNKPASIDGPLPGTGDTSNFGWNSSTGLLTQILKPADTGSVRPQIDFSYGAYTAGGATFYLPVSKTEKISSGTSVTTAFSWNAANKYVLQSVVVDPVTSGGTLNLTTAFSFDSLGNVTAIDGPLAGSSDTANYVWDSMRRLVFEIAPDPDGAGALGRRATKSTYDADGQITSVQRGWTTTATGSDFSVLETDTITYDAGRRRSRTTTAAGVTQFAYDGADRLICATVRMNPAVYASLPSDACTLGTAGANGPDRITKTTYDLAGQKLKEERGFGTPQVQIYGTYTYSLNGQPATVADARGNLSTMEYDGFDRLAKLRFPVTTVPGGTSSTTDYEQYGYDAAGNRVSVRRRDGQTIAYSFDALNREIVKDIPGGTSADVYTTYDLRDRVLSARFVSTSGQGVAAAYDKAGRMTSEATFGRTLSYQYDAADNRTKVTWPDALYVDYVYNAAGQLTEMRENGATSGEGRLAVFIYDNLGRRTGLNRNGLAATYDYDAASRLLSLVQNPASTANDITYGFTYSPASQLLARTDSNTTYHWAPPSAGTTANTYDGLNRDAGVVALEPDCALATAGYDCRGNLKRNGLWTYGYDVENRLVSATTSGTTASLTYDPQGRLASTVVNGTTTNFLYDGSRLVGEYDSGGAMLRRYVHGPGTDEPLAWYEGAGTMRRWLIRNYQGSVVAWSNSSGTVAAGDVYKYGPWGETSNWSGSRFQYTGQIALPELQLYYYKARVYDPEIGRFLQTDPIGYKDDLNLYAYVGGDPINKSDPTGTQDRFDQLQRQQQEYDTGLDLGQAEIEKGGVGVTVDAQVGAGTALQGGNVDVSGTAVTLRDGSGGTSNAIVATGSASMQGVTYAGSRQLTAVGGGQEGILGGGGGVSVGPTFTTARNADDLRGTGDTFTASFLGVSLQVTRGDNGVLTGTVSFGPGVNLSITKQRTNTEIIYDSNRKGR